MCKTTKMNTAVATKIKNSNWAMLLPGKLDKITNVRKVTIASTSLIHPSFVDTIHWTSQQGPLHLRVCCPGFSSLSLSAIFTEDAQGTWRGRAGPWNYFRFHYTSGSAGPGQRFTVTLTRQFIAFITFIFNFFAFHRSVSNKYEIGLEKFSFV